MENYTTLLKQQQAALTKDIDELVAQIVKQEEVLDELKDRKSLAFKELRSIEKKLEKLKV